MSEKRLIYLMGVVGLLWLVTLTVMVFNKTNPNVESTTTIVQKEVNGFSTDLTEVAQKVNSSIVTIESDGQYSSGFFYLKDDNVSYFLTSYHGLGQNITIHLANKYQIKATLHSYDIYTDLALLSCELPFEMQQIVFGKADLLSMGEFVFSIATPASLDYEATLALGLISSSERVLANKISFNNNIYNYYQSYGQLSLEASEGYSGAGVFNMEGELVGMIVSSTYEKNKLAFFVKAEELEVIARRLLENNNERLLLGIKTYEIAQMEDYLRSYYGIPLQQVEGLYVAEVLNNSIAKKVGFNNGDILLSINGNKLEDNFGLFLQCLEISEEYDFLIKRGEEEIHLKYKEND